MNRGLYLKPLATGQTRCWDISGQEVACADSGQDGELRLGLSWPGRRFEALGSLVRDHLTGLIWSRDANPGGFPCTWNEALAAVRRMNRDGYGGRSDWRLPNRNELRSLCSYQARNPALPESLPVDNVFLGWYWTSSTAAIHPAYAWSIHLEGARMFYGRKEQEQLFWPVAGQGKRVLPVTGQERCFDARGRVVSCRDTGQDGELRVGAPWPLPRFRLRDDLVDDRLTGLCWSRCADPVAGPLDWGRALSAIRHLNKISFCGQSDWRLPTINQLASLVDCARHTPALPGDHPFIRLHDGYWSSTTSFFETDWAWVLYLDKGACGVGHKARADFFVWPVRTGCKEIF